MRHSKLVLALVYTALLFSAPAGAHRSTPGGPSPNEPDPKQHGSWFSPPMAENPQDRMQAVHIALLPDETVLIVNGSSNRNRFIEGQIKDGVDVSKQEVVNNAGIFDPNAASETQSGFTRISVPPTPDADGEATDLFCSGHLHLADGNVLFAGGSLRYYPTENFSGHKSAFIFDWQGKKWLSAGKMHDGHWYPSLVPMSDGRMAVFSGIDYGGTDNSPVVEFFDSERFQSNPADPGAAWSSVDLREVDGSPYTTTYKNPKNNNRNPDKLAHYPRLYTIRDGRIFITGHGSGMGRMDTLNTYLMSISSDWPPQVSFEPGPDRLLNPKWYGTAVVDPNNPDDILLIGGMQGSDNINHGPDANTIPDATVTAALERIHLPAESSDWKVDYSDNFLGKAPEDVRIMHLSVILPTKQLLVISGGNYAYHRPTYTPLLLTHDPKAPGGYRIDRMNAASQPRLYHNTALLLPDGRVFTAGGNPGRALRFSEPYSRSDSTYKPGDVELGIRRNPNKTYQIVEDGDFVLPAENWRIEIFSPPYLFIDGPRPEFINRPTGKTPLVLHYGQSQTVQVEHMTEQASLILVKPGSVTHGWDSGQRLSALHLVQMPDQKRVEFNAPQNPHIAPPGYYMLFYVNDKGQPSHAAWVQLKKG